MEQDTRRTRPVVKPSSFVPDTGRLARYPEWSKCPEKCSASGISPLASTLYRGYLIHAWVVPYTPHGDSYCLTPYGDLAGIPTILAMQYQGHHEIVVDGVRAETKHIPSLRLSDLLDFIDRQWEPFDEALAAFARGEPIRHDTDSWTPCAAMYPHTGQQRTAEKEES